MVVKYYFPVTLCLFEILAAEESRLERKRAENYSHQSVTSVNEGWWKRFTTLTFQGSNFILSFSASAFIFIWLSCVNSPAVNLHRQDSQALPKNSLLRLPDANLLFKEKISP